MRVSLEPDARLEAIDGANWYEEKEAGLGELFLQALAATQLRIGRNPERYRCFQGHLRKCQFKRFPYLLVFRIRGEEVQILAVMHTSRRPGYWENRD